MKNVKVNTANPATTNATASPTHAYNYDSAGNRISSLDNGLTTNYSSNSVNAYTNISGGGILPPNQNPTYDPNGNMLTGPVGAPVSGGSSLSYDKENRLRTITTGTTSTSTHRYTWGLDLSGSMEGAGGVGGLLAIERNVSGNSTWDIRYPHYDANGNIIALTDSAGSVSARYRYDAFGKTLSTEDTDNSGWAVHNIHGFSTKPNIANTGLLYYGYRHYAPTLGRWIKRDPIEESGGVNLYGFVGNDGVYNWDYLGNNPAICAPAVIPLTSAAIALAFGMTLENCMKDPNCSEAVNNIAKIDTSTVCLTVVAGTAYVGSVVKDATCCCLQEAGEFLAWGAKNAAQVACMAAANALFLATDAVCDKLPGKYRTKCHEDALKQLRDDLAACKP